jgi:cystathionine gamma-lyase
MKQKQNKIFLKALESHPQHAIYKKQMKGFGGMMSIYIRGGLEETKVFLKSFKVIIYRPTILLN